MSNLSELLPTGGGQNAVDFVASGTLSSGQTVVLNSDGTVSAVDSTGEFGTPVNYDIGGRYFFATAWDLEQNKILVGYRDQYTSNYPLFVVGTPSGSTISFGTPVVFTSNFATGIEVVWHPTYSCFVLLSLNYGTLRFANATISGTTYSLSSTLSTLTSVAECMYKAFVYYPPQDSIVFAFSGPATTYYGTVMELTMSSASTTGTFSTPHVFYSGNCNQMDMVYYPPTNGLFLATRANNSQGISYPLTVSSGSFSFGSFSAFGTDPAYINLTYDAAQQRIVGVYADTNFSYQGRVIAGYINSGNGSAVLGTPVTFDTNAVYTSGIAYSSLAQKTYIFTVEGGAASNPLRAVPLSISNTTITLDTAIYEDTIDAVANTSSYQTAEYNENLGTIFVATQSNDPFTYMNYGMMFTTTNYTDFIGITAGAISDTATGAVNVYGGINEAQTGLTIGADYYVQADGSLSTTASDVKAGRAISATTINMMDLT